MRPRTLPRTLGRLATIGLGCVFASSHASANVVIAEYVNSNHFDYHIQYMPDLDQRRTGVFGNGSSYCVPTSTLNMLSYAAEWGVDDMDPGPGVYNFDVGYNAMTNHLDDLGTLMGTGINCGGTCISDWHDGLETWMDGQPLVAYSDFYNANFSPKASDLALMAAWGGLVSFAYGRWDFNPAPVPIVAGRTSGHAVTMMYAHADGPDDMALWARDPADEGVVNLNSQSPWAYQIYDVVENMTILGDLDNDGLFNHVEVTVLDYDEDDPRMFIIDFILALFPAGGFSFDTVQMNTVYLGGTNFTTGTNPIHFSPPSGKTFRDAVVHPAMHSFYVSFDGLASEPETIAHINRVNGTQTEMFELRGASELAMGRNGDLYISAGTSIHLAPRSELDNLTISKSLHHGGSVQDMVYRDDTDELIAVSTADRELLVLPRNLGSEVDPWFSYPLPNVVPTSPEAKLSIHPKDGRMALVTSADPQSIYLLTLENPGPQGRVNAQRIQTPTLIGDTIGVDFDDQGHLLATQDHGTVNELHQVSQTLWLPVPNSRYAHLNVRGEFRVARSRTSYDPDVHRDVNNFIPIDELPQIGRRVFDGPQDHVLDRRRTAGGQGPR